MSNIEINKKFWDIVGTPEGKAPSEISLRIAEVAKDSFLRAAVKDHLSAEITLLFADESVKARASKELDDASDIVFTVLSALQYDFGLSDDDALRAVEFCRQNIQQTDSLFD